jgi:hypothetical protein
VYSVVGMALVKVPDTPCHSSAVTEYTQWFPSGFPISDLIHFGSKRLRVVDHSSLSSRLTGEGNFLAHQGVERLRRSAAKLSIARASGLFLCPSAIATPVGQESGRDLDEEENRNVLPNHPTQVVSTISPLYIALKASKGSYSVCSILGV